jgi:hypothetical protein
MMGVGEKGWWLMRGFTGYVPTMKSIFAIEVTGDTEVIFISSSPGYNSLS